MEAAKSWLKSQEERARLNPETKKMPNELSKTTEIATTHQVTITL